MYKYTDGKITAERLTLRPFTVDDADAVAFICNDAETQKTTLSLPYPYLRDHAVQWISGHDSDRRDGNAYCFAICDRENGTLYGSISLSIKKPNGAVAELGYMIGREYWGNGYATEAVRGIIEYAFSELMLHRVYAVHLGSNTASGRVMLKAGMKYEGTMRDHIFKRGRYEDAVIYGIVNMDFDTYG